MATITAPDNEFAVSTGRNIDATANSSYFDYPPTIYTNLTITSAAGDARPDLFELGETYTLTYYRYGTPLQMQGTVIRSDTLGQEQGAVVFEGTDARGPIQLMWTQNFNVDQWIYTTRASGSRPAFWTEDQTREETWGQVCFTAGTPITTPLGPRPVESLAPGDAVLTRDGGAGRLVWTGRRQVLGTGAAAPVRIAPGVLGNTLPLLVSQQHRLLLAGSEAELLFGAPEVLVPAKALLNGSTVELAPCRTADYVHLLLETHEILDAAGAAAESLYLGDVALGVLEGGAMGEIASLFPELARESHLRRPGMQAARSLLRYGEARVLARQMGIVPAAGACRPLPCALLSA